MSKMGKMLERKQIILKSIEELEAKRKRSECGLVNSIIQNREVDEQDVRYFNDYTAKISAYEEELKELEGAIAELRKVNR